MESATLWTLPWLKRHTYPSGQSSSSTICRRSLGSERNVREVKEDGGCYHYTHLRARIQPPSEYATLLPTIQPRLLVGQSCPSTSLVVRARSPRATSYLSRTRAF